MASVRTISFGDAKFKNWETNKIYCIPFVFNDILKWHYDYIKPNLKVKSFDEIRYKAFNIIHDAIVDHKVYSMTDLVNLIMAMKITLVDENEKNDDGFCKVSLYYPTEELYIRYTFFNIMWHFNNHCRQLYQCCSIQGIRKYSNCQTCISYTTGEWKDRNRIGIDFSLKKSTYHHNYNNFQ